MDTFKLEEGDIATRLRTKSGKRASVVLTYLSLASITKTLSKISSRLIILNSDACGHSLAHQAVLYVVKKMCKAG